MPSVRFGVLGPLRAEDEHGPVDLKGPRHRAVLARLLVARGRVVPSARLVDDLWETPPDGAPGLDSSRPACVWRTKLAFPQHSGTVAASM